VGKFLTFEPPNLPPFQLPDSPPRPCCHSLGPQLDVAIVAALVYLAAFDGGGDGAARLAQVGAVAEAALAQIRAKLRERVGQLIGGYHPQAQLSQARRIGYRSAAGQLYQQPTNCGVPPLSVRLAYLPNFEVQSWVKGVQ